MPIAVRAWRALPIAQGTQTCVARLGGTRGGSLEAQGATQSRPRRVWVRCAAKVLSASWRIKQSFVTHCPGARGWCALFVAQGTQTCVARLGCEAELRGLHSQAELGNESDLAFGPLPFGPFGPFGPIGPLGPLGPLGHAHPALHPRSIARSRSSSSRS